MNQKAAVAVSNQGQAINGFSLTPNVISQIQSSRDLSNWVNNSSDLADIFASKALTEFYAQ